MSGEHQYEIFARPGADLARDIFKPRPGFVLSGIVPGRVWNTLVYRRQEAVNQLRAAIDSNPVSGPTTPPRAGQDPQGGAKKVRPLAEKVGDE